MKDFKNIFALFSVVLFAFSCSNTPPEEAPEYQTQKTILTEIESTALQFDQELLLLNTDHDLMEAMAEDEASINTASKHSYLLTAFEAVLENAKNIAPQFKSTLERYAAGELNLESMQTETTRLKAEFDKLVAEKDDLIVRHDQIMDYFKSLTPVVGEK